MFNPIVPKERVNRLFRIVAGSRQHAPARRELQATFDRLPKPDGNFIKDFQTTGFSARVWELYLAAYARSIGAEIAQPHERPDFLLFKASEQVWIEASTANPTEGLVPQTAQEKRTEWEEEDALAIKLGSVLWTKLNKRYWELDMSLECRWCSPWRIFIRTNLCGQRPARLPGISTARIPSSSRTAEASLNAKPIV